MKVTFEAINATEALGEIIKKYGDSPIAKALLEKIYKEKDPDVQDGIIYDSIEKGDFNSLTLLYENDIGEDMMKIFGLDPNEYWFMKVKA